MDALMLLWPEQAAFCPTRFFSVVFAERLSDICCKKKDEDLRSPSFRGRYLVG
jgi:hypothetical protein